MRMVLILNESERQALKAMSENDLRFPREQLRYLLRLEAIRRGLLPADNRLAPEVQHGRTG